MAARILGIVALLGMGSCVMWPAPKNSVGNGMNRFPIDDQCISALIVGVTTRAHVVLRIGEPDYVSLDERRLGYVWSRVVSTLYVWPINHAEEIMRTDALLLRFDANGVLVAMERPKTSGFWDSNAPLFETMENW